MVKHKITAAGLPAGIVQRVRLFLLLDDCCQKPVAWISGPGGSGKTTLVSSYLASRSVPAIWYQVDQGDADPATFFYYMALASQDAARPDHEPLPLLTPEYLGGIKTFARRYFQQLFARLPAPCAIVLDNYQEISPSSPFSEQILAKLCRNRFFTRKISPADPIYQYHPLFREFLLARAEKTFPATRAKSPEKQGKEPEQRKSKGTRTGRRS